MNGINSIVHRADDYSFYFFMIQFYVLQYAVRFVCKTDDCHNALRVTVAKNIDTYCVLRARGTAALPKSHTTLVQADVCVYACDTALMVIFYCCGCYKCKHLFFILRSVHFIPSINCYHTHRLNNKIDT